MDCTTAQQMIAEGVAPGSTTREQAQLGFHLSRCAACRAAYAAAHPAPPPTAAPPIAPAASVVPAAPPTPRRWLRRASGVLLLLLLAGVLYLGVVIGRTSQNVQAMIIQPVSQIELPTLTATPAPPATPPPTATPLPSSTATSTPTASPTATATPRRAAAVREVFNDVPVAQRVPIITLTPAPTGQGKASGALSFFNPFRPTDTPTTTPAPPPTATPRPTNTPPVRPVLPLPPQLPAGIVSAPGQAITVLLVGVDQRPDEIAAPRADALMVASIDPTTRRVALLSLPRDLWVEIPGGYGYNRINTAYQYGEATGIPGGGLALTRATVSSLLGVAIDYVAMVDFYGFIALVDTVGGIEVNVPYELYDAAYPTMDYGYTTVHFYPGVQWMDGSTALIYSRVRNPDSDFMRIRRQQDVIEALGLRLQERGDLLTLLTLDQTSAALLPYVRTDMPRDTIVSLFWNLRGIARGEIEHYALTLNEVSMGLGDDRFALVPDYTALRSTVSVWLGYR